MRASGIMGCARQRQSALPGLVHAGSSRNDIGPPIGYDNFAKQSARQRPPASQERPGQKRNEGYDG
jgi:hypothetical protein